MRRLSLSCSSVLDVAETDVNEVLPNARQLASSRIERKKFSYVTLHTCLGKTRKSRSCLIDRRSNISRRSSLKRRSLCQRIIARDQRKRSPQIRITKGMCGDFAMWDCSPHTVPKHCGKLKRSKEGQKLLVSVALGDGVSVKGDMERRFEPDDCSHNSSFVGLLDEEAPARDGLLCPLKEKESQTSGAILDGSAKSAPREEKVEYLSRRCSDLSTELAVCVHDAFACS